MDSNTINSVISNISSTNLFNVKYVMKNMGLNHFRLNKISNILNKISIKI